MSRFLRICAVLSATFFATNVFAAGYTCNDIKKYTSCNAGYYMTVDGAYNGTATVGNACTLCPAGYYCTGGTANKTACPGGTYGETTGLSTSACTASCPDFYTNSDPASTSMSSCYALTSAGSYIATANDTTETTCPADPSYCPGNVRVYYGTTGGNITCPGNYTANTTEGKFSAFLCQTYCGAGYRVTTPGGACERNVVPGGWFMTGHNVGYGDVSPVSYCSNTFDNQSSAAFGNHASKNSACRGTVNAGNAGTLYAPHVYQLRLRNLSSTDTLWISYAYATNGSTNLLQAGKEKVDYEMLGNTGPIYSGRNTTTYTILDRYGANPTLTDYAASVAPGGTITWLLGTQTGVSVSDIAFGLTHENAMNGSLSTVSIPFAVEVLRPSYSQEWTTIYDTRTRSYADLSGVLGAGITLVDITPMVQSPCDLGTYAGFSSTITGGYTKSCTSAAAGYYVPAKGATAQTMCPAGKYTDTTGKSSCSTISAGYYSTGGGTSATPTAAGNGCISGQTCGTINAGYYSTGGGTSATPTATGNGCISGQTCGTIAAGRWGAAGATTAQGSGTVSAGYYSTGGGTSATPTENGNGCVGDGNTCGTIAAGYWGAAGATTAQGSGEVDGGYYSTGGGTSATPTENGNGCVGDGNTCGLTDENCYSNGTGGTSSCPVACSVFGDFYKYSDKGSVSYTACHGTLEPGYAVMEGSAAVVECPAGYACPGGETIYLEQSGGYTVCTDDQYQNETGQSTCKTCTGPAPYDTWLYSADILEPGTPHQFCAHHFFYGNADDPKMDEFISEFSNGMDLKTNPNYQPFNGGIIYGYAQYLPDNLDEMASIVSVPAYINPGYWYPQAQDDDLSDEGQTYTSFQDMYEDTIVPVDSGYWSAGSTGFYKASTRNTCPTGYDDGSATASAENQCVLSTSAGKFVKTANSGEETCTCGGYCPGGINVNYGSTGGKTNCPAGTAHGLTGASDASKCDIVPAGAYAEEGSCGAHIIDANCWGDEEGATTSCPNPCPDAYPYSEAGANEINECYLITSPGKYVEIPGEGQVLCREGGFCPGGKLIFKGGTSTTWGGRTECDNWTYAEEGATSCTACTEPEDGFYKASGTGWTSYSSCKETKPMSEVSQYCLVGGGDMYKYQSSPTAWGESNVTGLMAVPGAIVSYADQTCIQCPAGKRSSGGSSTSCKTCDNWTYSEAGSSSCTSCAPVPDAVDGISWTKATGTGWGSYTKCEVTQTPANCASGTVKRNQTDASTWGDTTLVSTLKSIDGYYASATDTSCSVANDGYYATAGATNQTACAIGSYSEKTSASTKCIACPTGRTTSGTGTKYNATANTACSATCSNADGVHTWAAPSWSANTVSNLCTASKCNANTYYTATTGTNYKNTCTACGSYSTTSAGNTSTTCACDTGYTDDGTVGGDTTTTSAACKLISDIACLTGQYLPAKATSCSTCTAGNYCPSSAKTYSYSTSTQGLTPCAAGTYQPGTGKTSCIDASAGYYVSGTGKTSQTKCTGATYQPNTGQSSCLTCPTAENLPSGVTVKSYGYWISGGIPTERSGCSAYFNSIDLDDGTMGASYCYIDEDADSYGMTGTSKNGCYVMRKDLTCDGGYYNKTFAESSTATQMNSVKTLATAKEKACTDVGSGYWSGADELTRTACATGLVTCGAGKCANEAADCGRILHAGNQSIYLRSAARTSPALNVKIGNQTFFGALSTSYSSALKVKNDGTTYSVVNDYQ